MTIACGQPTLSTQLKQLEETIGKPLLERRNRKMVLADTGKSALEYVWLISAQRKIEIP